MMQQGNSMKTADLSGDLSGTTKDSAATGGFGDAATPNDAGTGLTVVIAGGGTGGHLFPGIAIAGELMQRFPGTRVVFVTSGKSIEKTVLGKTNFETRLIAVEGIKGKGIFAKFSALRRLPGGLMTALGLLREVKPHVVIGMGAYSAGPVVAAAWMLGMHRVIHEQNCIPGLTNRLLAGLAEKIYVSFPGTGPDTGPGTGSHTGFKSSVHHKIWFTGNPVRRDILAPAAIGERLDAPVDEFRNRFTVLVLGGSQGAHSINMAVLDSLIYLQDMRDADRFCFVHQTGEKDAEEVNKVYRQMKITAEVAPFFSDMGSLYRRADLVVCRSGATTVAELTVLGKAAVFIPFPFAADDHQVGNAKALVEEDAAAMILEKDLNGRLLAEKMMYYARHPAETDRMASDIRKFGHPDAAQKIADDICRLIGRRPFDREAAATV